MKTKNTMWMLNRLIKNNTEVLPVIQTLPSTHKEAGKKKKSHFYSCRSRIQIIKGKLLNEHT